MDDTTTVVSGDKKPKKGAKGGVLTLALSRFEVGVSANSDSRERQLSDLKFAAASPDDDWQWPTYAIETRKADGTGVSARPQLTINQLPQHIRQVTNDQRQNRPMGRVIPADSGADVEVAEVLNGMVRAIQNSAEYPADIAYDTACEAQVTHGEGYWRITTDYVDERSFDQEARIEAIPNPFSVYMDPTMKRVCGEDAKWAFITNDMDHDEFEAEFPNATTISGMLDSGVNDQSMGDWLGKDTIRVAEYFCYDVTPEMLYLFADGKAFFESEDEYKLRVESGAVPINKRKSSKTVVKHYKLNGYEILEENIWPGKYIPIIRVIGNAFIIEGKVYISGIVRNAKDAQRMYNYHASQEVEMLALAPKAPYIMYGGQAEGYEDDWKTANTKNHPYLQVNPDVMDGNGNLAPFPQRAQPPMVQSGIIAAKQAALEDIKATTGQYNASLGQPSNERSGKAIIARQREGDVGTFHYVDNLARAIRWTVCQLIDLIPKIYDTRRVARTLGEDGETSETVIIDPELNQAKFEEKDDQGIVIRKIYNPGVGKYDVVAVTGPGYSTKRQEAAEGAVALIQTNPGLMDSIGDLVVKNFDWPGATEMAKRLKKGIDPRFFEDNDNPALQQANLQIQQLGEQLEQATMMLQKASQSFEAREVAVKEAEVEIKKVEAQIRFYEAETKRIQATSPGLTEEQVQDIALGTLHAVMAQGAFGGLPPIPQLPETPTDPGMGQPQQPTMMPPQEGVVQ